MTEKCRGSGRISRGFAAYITGDGCVCREIGSRAVDVDSELVARPSSAKR